MGWKSLVEHYKLNSLHVKVDGGNFVASTGVYEVIFDRNANVIKNDVYQGSFAGANKRRLDLVGFCIAVDGDKETFKRLFSKEDSFSKSIDVYTFSNGSVVKKQCEQFKPLELTHDGDVIFENTHFLSHKDAVDCLINNLKASINAGHNTIEMLESELKNTNELVAKSYADLASLYNIKEGQSLANI